MLHTQPNLCTFSYRKYVQETVSELKNFASTVVPFESLPNKYLGNITSTMAQETAFMTEEILFSVRPALKLKKQLSTEYEIIGYKSPLLRYPDDHH
jgi:hypothetical protein